MDNLEYITHNGETAYIKLPVEGFKSQIYPVAVMPDSFPNWDIHDDINFLQPYRYGPFIMKKYEPVLISSHFFCWLFDGGSDNDYLGFQLTLSPRMEYIKEMWQLFSAIREMKLELILGNSHPISHIND